MTRKKIVVLSLCLVLSGLFLAGCGTVKFYHQAALGQWELIRNKRPVNSVLNDASTPEALKRQLRLVQDLVEFAKTDLGLPSDGAYSDYVDLNRPFVVYNVFAAPFDSLEPKEWWYPLVGRLSYRGYFRHSMAKEVAEQLRTKGYDVYVGGIRAYSTLGWFHDPVLNTFIFEDELFLAETIFHELSHKRVFLSGDTEFNEAFASFIEEEGTHRWLKRRNSPTLEETYRRYLARKHAFHRLLVSSTSKLKTDLEALAAEKKSGGLHPERIENLKQFHILQLRKSLQNLQAQWGGNGEFKSWIDGEINNARLSAIDTYWSMVPHFKSMFDLVEGDLSQFYSKVESMGDLPRTTPSEALRLSFPQAMEQNEPMLGNPESH